MEHTIQVGKRSYTKKTLRTRLYKFLRRKEVHIMWFGGKYANPTVQRTQLAIITDLRNYLTHYLNKPLQAHLNLLAMRQDEWNSLLPGESSKHQQLRQEIQGLVAYAKEHNTLKVQVG